jgi:hypothetical protein
MFLTGSGRGLRPDQFHRQLGGFFGPWYVGVVKDMTGSRVGIRARAAGLTLLLSRPSACRSPMRRKTRRPCPSGRKQYEKMESQVTGRNRPYGI